IYKPPGSEDPLLLQLSQGPKGSPLRFSAPPRPAAGPAQAWAQPPHPPAQPLPFLCCSKISLWHL
ncbi:unnamed protein product, partial [Gulo gulo]